MLENSILGANLRTGCQGIFPLAHVVDIEYNEFDPSNHGGSLNAGGIKGGDGRKERYLLSYLGSIESTLYKGNVVLCQAVRKIVTSKFKPKPHPTVLEISDKGIKIVDKTKIIVSTVFNLWISYLWLSSNKDKTNDAFKLNFTFYTF